MTTPLESLKKYALSERNWTFRQHKRNLIGFTTKDGVLLTADNVGNYAFNLERVPNADDNPGVNYTYGYLMALNRILEKIEALERKGGETHEPNTETSGGTHS